MNIIIKDSRESTDKSLQYREFQNVVGTFIDISTGAPITGVARFYELENLLTFNTDIDATMQKLSKISRNKKFVMNFESRTKKFAKPALDKCTEIADDVWSEYLDKAMLDIYYAQKAKVAEIKQGCFDFVSNCYEASEASITAAMSQLIGDSDVVLQPDRIKLSSEMCKNYVESCDNMFKKDGEETGIIAQYVAAREQEDVLAACRAVVRQCFDKYGGDGYENFYNPYSGLFETGYALDWFTLYDYTGTQKTLKSPCARQLTEITACNAKNSDDEYTIIEKAFGGLDLVYAKENENQTYQITNNTNDFKYYGIMQNESNLSHRTVRSVGVASEVYNQIIDTLSTQCRNINGRFIAFQFLQNNVYSYDNYCTWIDSRNESSEHFHNVMQYYGIWSGENMCPRNYTASVDTQSWGICSCWANGGRRSQNGASATCVPYLPLSEDQGSVSTCSSRDDISGDENNTTTQWCIQKTVDSANRVCPGGFYSLKKDNDNDNYNCVDNQNEPPKEFFEIYVLPDK